MIEASMQVEAAQREALARLEATERVKTMVIAFNIGEQSSQETAFLKATVALVQKEKRARLHLIEEEMSALEQHVDAWEWEQLRIPIQVRNLSLRTIFESHLQVH